MKTRITVLSDTHTKHGLIPMEDLPGGDMILFAGDLMNSGYNRNDIWDFCHWFQSLKQYEDKVFIAGNHDRMFENHPEEVKGYLKKFPLIDYLEDEQLTLYGDGPNGDMPEGNIRIYGSPWQPEFFNWAFNLPKNGIEIASKWLAIPDNTDILITHGPAYGTLDTVKGRQYDNLGCGMLAERIKVIKPKIHICGHIHSGYGYYFDGTTHYFNASVLNERYNFENKPFNIEWDKQTNEIVFI
jgi:UDP-2,3-diacylglucosamine pyrophosphatase LpxH